MTKHNSTCTMRYGKASGHSDCPRCEELKAGAPARTQPWRKRHEDRITQRADIAAHFRSEKHRTGGCGPVCTFGDW